LRKDSIGMEMHINIKERRDLSVQRHI
jgi:hypothetical protein